MLGCYLVTAKGKSYLQIGLFRQRFYSNIILRSIYFHSVNPQTCEHTEDSFTFRYKSHSSFELILCWSGLDSDALSLLDSISVSLPERKTQDKVFTYIYVFKPNKSLELPETDFSQIVVCLLTVLLSFLVRLGWGGVVWRAGGRMSVCSLSSPVTWGSGGGGEENVSLLPFLSSYLYI